MKSFRQHILSAKIEYHWWRARGIEKRIKSSVSACNERRYSAVNLHKYMAERALIEYEVSVGLRDRNGFWITR